MFCECGLCIIPKGILYVNDLTDEQEEILEDLFDKAIEEASATNDLNTASGWYDTEILGEWEK